MKAGDKVKFTGCSIEQRRWGSNDDERDVLEAGNIYTAREIEEHSWHTHVYLVEIAGKFNSACFKVVD